MQTDASGICTCKREPECKGVARVNVMRRREKVVPGYIKSWPWLWKHRRVCCAFPRTSIAESIISTVFFDIANHEAFCEYLFRHQIEYYTVHLASLVYIIYLFTLYICCVTFIFRAVIICFIRNRFLIVVLKLNY